MTDSKKRSAEDAFVKHESNTHRPKKRRLRKDRGAPAVKDEGMVDASSGFSQEEARKTSTDTKTNHVEGDPPQSKIAKLPLAAHSAESSLEELAKSRSSKTKRRKSKKTSKEKDLEKLGVDHIGPHAVVKAGAKRSLKKKELPHWNLTQDVGGTFVDQDPMLADRDQYLLLATETSVQIYSTKTSLLVRTLHISDNEPATSCFIDPSEPNSVFVSRLGGLIQRWDWSTNTRLDQWQCQQDLVQIVAIVPETSGRWKLLTAHGAPGENSRLLESTVSTETTGPDEEVLLLTRTGHWSVCKCLDNGNVLFLTRGKQLTIGQLLPAAKDLGKKTYTWREVTLPQPIVSMDIRVRDRPKAAGSNPVKINDVVVGCLDGVILMYEDLLYRLIGREKGVKDIDILTRRLAWHRQAVNTVKWSRDGNYLISGGNETVLVIWQLDTNQQQFLPHLSTPILNLTVSGAGSSYALRLADNSVMVLSTADLLPSANISGLALRDDPSHFTPVAVNPRDPDQFLIAISADPLARERSSATLLQAFDTHTARQIYRQAIARNMTTALRISAEGGRVHEPHVSHLKVSHDGGWLVTIDEWHPKPRDLDPLHTAYHGQTERSRSFETCLRFWKWQEKGSTWELVTRVDEPQSTTKKSVFDLAMHPTKLEASTIGSDGYLRIWSPMARHRDGVAVKDKTGQSLYTWMCSKSAQLEPEPPMTIDLAESSATMAYSEDGSVIAASWSWSSATKRVLHLVNARTAELKLTQANVVSTGPAQLAFNGRYLLALSRKFCVWDTVTLRKTYSISLRHTSRDGKFLAVNAQDNTFALAFDSRQPGLPSNVAVFDARDPYKGPLHQGILYGHVRLLLSHVRSPGYLLIDSEARIRHLNPPGAVRSDVPMVAARPENPTRGLKDIFGMRVVNPAGDVDGEAQSASRILPAPDSNAEQKSLDGVLSSLTSSKMLPSVREMFQQVTSLFARKPASAS